MQKAGWLNICIALLFAHSVIGAPPFAEFEHKKSEVKEEVFEEVIDEPHRHRNHDIDFELNRERERDIERAIEREREEVRREGRREKEVDREFERDFEREKEKIEADFDKDIGLRRLHGFDIGNDIEHDIERAEERIKGEEDLLEREGAREFHSPFDDQVVLRTPLGSEFINDFHEGGMEVMSDEREEHTSHSSSKRFEEVIRD